MNRSFNRTHCTFLNINHCSGLRSWLLKAGLCQNSYLRKILEFLFLLWLLKWHQIRIKFMHSHLVIFRNRHIATPTYRWPENGFIWPKPYRRANSLCLAAFNLGWHCVVISDPRSFCSCGPEGLWQSLLYVGIATFLIDRGLFVALLILFSCEHESWKHAFRWEASTRN